MDLAGRRRRKEIALAKLKTAPNTLPLVEKSTPLNEQKPEDDTGPSCDALSPPPITLAFIPKAARKHATGATETEVQILQRNERETLKKEEFKEMSKLFVRSILQQEFEAARTGRKSTHLNEQLLDVDDTDDPEKISEDMEAWTLRELLRLKRRAEEEEAMRAEREALAQVRNLQGEALETYLKEKETIVLAAKESEQQEPSKFTFLQKYYHGGVFFSADVQTSAPHLFKDREAAALPTASEAGVDKSLLPEMMQVRNYGKSSRSKWTHLSAEDTTAYDGPWYVSKKKLAEQRTAQMEREKQQETAKRQKF